MKSEVQNPYQSALDGLELADPVRAFFDWCAERENIRSKRESGMSPPWSEDSVFQEGRFLNVFREDDPGTKAVLRFAEPVKESLSDSACGSTCPRSVGTKSPPSAAGPRKSASTKDTRSPRRLPTHTLMPRPSAEEDAHPLASRRVPPNPTGDPRSEPGGLQGSPRRGSSSRRRGRVR